MKFVENISISLSVITSTKRLAARRVLLTLATGFKIQYYHPVFQSGRNHKFFRSFRRNPVHLNISNRKPIYSIRLPEITFARCRQFALGLTWLGPGSSKNKCSPAVSSRKKSRTNEIKCVLRYFACHTVSNKRLPTEPRIREGEGQKNSSTYIIYISPFRAHRRNLRIFPSSRSFVEI